MLFTVDELKEKLSAILQSDNQGVTSEILVDVQNNYTGALTQIEELTKRAEKLEADNADLVLANGKLFQAVGVAKEPEPETATNEETKTVEEVLEEMLEGGK